MAKKRYIDTRFWSDGYVVNSDIIERYLFLYFLTNEHTNISGIYELPTDVVARETGLEREMLEKMYHRFKDKIYFIDGWIIIKNFIRYQGLNPNVVKGIERELNNIPDDIAIKIQKNDDIVESLRKALKGFEQLNLTKLNLKEYRSSPKGDTPILSPVDDRTPPPSSALPPPQKSPHHEIIKFFYDEYQKQTGVKYMFNKGKDDNAVKRALKLQTSEELKEIIMFFFGSKKAKTEDYAPSLAIALSVDTINLWRKKFTHNPYDV